MGKSCYISKPQFLKGGRTICCIQLKQWVWGSKGGKCGKALGRWKVMDKGEGHWCQYHPLKPWMHFLVSPCFQEVPWESNNDSSLKWRTKHWGSHRVLETQLIGEICNSIRGHLPHPLAPWMTPRWLSNCSASVPLRVGVPCAHEAPKSRTNSAAWDS